MSERQISRREFIGSALLVGATIVGASFAREYFSEGEKGLEDPEKRSIAESVISTFENSTLELQYGYAENIGDGRGITAGRSGFASGANSLLYVVEIYDKETSGDNSLSEYLPALRKIQEDKEAAGEPYGISDSVTGLDGFIEDWGRASQTDPRLRIVQDKAYEEVFFSPAIKKAKGLGIKTALGQLIILDTIIQHGDGSEKDPDSLDSIIKQTNQQLSSKDEIKWLAEFLRFRKKHLLMPAEEKTREAWRQSIPRVDALQSMLVTGNYNLDLPLSWTVYGDEFNLD